MITLNQEVPRINSKKFKEVAEIIENARQIMIEKFGLDIKIIIDNKMHYRGYLEVLEENKGIVEKFGDIYIRVAGQTLNMVLTLIAHEFAHVTYSNIHLKYGCKSKYKSKNENYLHKKLQDENLKEIINRLGIKVY